MLCSVPLGPASFREIEIGTSSAKGRSFRIRPGSCLRIVIPSSFRALLERPYRGRVYSKQRRCNRTGALRLSRDDVSKTVHSLVTRGLSFNIVRSPCARGLKQGEERCPTSSSPSWQRSSSASARSCWRPPQKLNATAEPSSSHSCISKSLGEVRHRNRRE